MRSKFILTLWLAGAVLYAGSTAFLAHAVLGGGSVSTPADKAKATKVAAAADAQCEKDNLASKDAKPDDTKPAKDNAADPQKTAAIEPKKPAPAPAAAKPASPETAKRDDATPGLNTRAPQQQPVEEDASAGDQQDQTMLGPDGKPIPDGWQDQGGQDQGGMTPDAGEDQDAMGPGGPGAGEEPAEADEWANVIAGTADMRSEPSMQAPLVYALPAGWQVRVIARQPGWVQVQDANSGAAGWVESSALAPVSGPKGPQGDPRYGGYDRRGPYDRYADETYPYGAPPPPWRGRRHGNEFGDFFRRALSGF
jgi:hypothetical protein